MSYLKIDSKVIESIKEDLASKGILLSTEEIEATAASIGDRIVNDYVDRLITQVDSIIEINPYYSEQDILRTVARRIVDFLGAKAATVRIYDPSRGEMISYGSYPEAMENLEAKIRLEDTVAGRVMSTRESYCVANLEDEKSFEDKERLGREGIHSLLAVPISIPRFSLKDLDTEGVLQIYFGERGRKFAPLEAKIVDLFARRVSYVIARRRIMELQKMNTTKDKIVEKIFTKLGRREGIKMKDLFNQIIPELVDIMRIQRCSLFSVMDDRRHVLLEAGYPEAQHGIGKIFSIEEPYVRAVVLQPGPFGEYENEKIYPDYILIINPQKSQLLPAHLKKFLEAQRINSVLYIPLKVNDEVKYFLVFDAQAHHKRFRDEEIEIFTFFGKELMKGLRLEKMDDILHDFKNPAIAVAGFAKRIQKLLSEGEYVDNREKVDRAIDVILKETSRLQEMALTLHGEGREETVDMTEKLVERFLINEEAVKELGRKDVRLVVGDLVKPLRIRCYPLHVERVFDNLLNNASNAVPKEGGFVSIRSLRKDPWAVAEITNSGEISQDEVERYLLGESRGRGFHITTRLIKRMGGKVELESGAGQTTLRVMFPLILAEEVNTEHSARQLNDLP